MSIALRAKKHAKRAVSLFERNVSPEVYNASYNFLFPKYKSLIRELYGLKRVGLAADDRTMARDIYEVIPYTFVGIGGLEATYRLARRMNEERIEGDFVELGVARGGAAALLARVAFDRGRGRRKLWLFDSFEGLPDPTAADFGGTNGSADATGDHVHPLRKGSCLGTLDQVQALLFDEFHFPREQIKFVKGWFQDTLPVHGKGIGSIAILRIDGDWYESTKCCLEYLFDQVVPGGAIIIDDYESCYGCKKAVDEFLAARALNPVLTFDGRGGCYFIRA